MLPLTTIATVPVLLGIGLGVLTWYYKSHSSHSSQKQIIYYSNPIWENANRESKCKICNKEISADTIIKELRCHKFHYRLAYYYSSSEQTYHKKVTNFTPSPMGGSSSKPSKSLKCKICNKEISANTIIKELSCGHKFHSKCWTTLEKQGHEVCPDCRRKDGQRMY